MGHMTEFTSKLFVKAKEKDLPYIVKELQKRNLYFVDVIIEIGPIHHYYDTLTGDPKPSNTLEFRSNKDNLDDSPGHCFSTYGMGIPDAWFRGYTGKGVVIAILDVGVDVNISDLAPNIRNDLSYNFVSNNINVKPEKYPSYQAESLDITDHGNRCSGLIAAVKNSDCTTGIAFDAKIAVLKIFEIKRFRWAVPHFTDDAIARGLKFRPQDIHIYSNSWGAKTPFHKLDILAEEALKHGIKTGRNDKGAIFVFPAGPIGDGFSNSIYTIAVNSVGQFGRIPDFTEPCACTLTSTFGEGSSFNASEMVTTSHERNNFTSSFKGTSASTAMVSAIIGLALQANHELSWRDVQHIVVEASEHEGLKESKDFKKNAAGKYYHDTFGFGLLNASKVVSLAERWKHISDQIKQTNVTTIVRNNDNSIVHESEAQVQIRCRRNIRTYCVQNIEHVVVTLTLASHKEDELEILLLSPSGTYSKLVARQQLIFNGATLREHVEFQSVHFWGEQPIGTWKLILIQTSTLKGGDFGIKSFRLTIYGSVETIPVNSVSTNARTRKLAGEGHHKTETTEKTLRPTDIERQSKEYINVLESPEIKSEVTIKGSHDVKSISTTNVASMYFIAGLLLFHIMI